jgi:uncharacterized GH25 family protein
MQRTTVTVLGTLILLLTSTFASAHEFWIQTEHLEGEREGLVLVRLMHGERFAGQIVTRNEPQIERFEFVQQLNEDGEQIDQVRGRHQSPTSFLRPKNSGVIVYQSKHYTNILEWERFDAYLAEEGLGYIADERAKLGESKIIGREAYSRCAKSIQVMKHDLRSSAEIDQIVGLPLEVLLTSIESAPGGNGTQVLAWVGFEGQPIAGLRVVAVSKEDHTNLIELFTDDDGMVEFVAGQPGEWMLTTIHIQRADHIEDSEWESFWASSTFSIR